MMDTTTEITTPAGGKNRFRRSISAFSSVMVMVLVSVVFDMVSFLCVCGTVCQPLQVRPAIENVVMYVELRTYVSQQSV